MRLIPKTLHLLYLKFKVTILSIHYANPKITAAWLKLSPFLFAFSYYTHSLVFALLNNLNIIFTVTMSLTCHNFTMSQKVSPFDGRKAAFWTNSRLSLAYLEVFNFAISRILTKNQSSLSHVLIWMKNKSLLF